MSSSVAEHNPQAELAGRDAAQRVVGEGTGDDAQQRADLIAAAQNLRRQIASDLARRDQLRANNAESPIIATSVEMVQALKETWNDPRPNRGTAGTGSKYLDSHVRLDGDQDELGAADRALGLGISIVSGHGSGSLDDARSAFGRGVKLFKLGHRRLVEYAERIESGGDSAIAFLEFVESSCIVIESFAAAAYVAGGMVVTSLVTAGTVGTGKAVTMTAEQLSAGEFDPKQILREAGTEAVTTFCTMLLGGKLSKFFVDALGPRVLTLVQTANPELVAQLTPNFIDELVKMFAGAASGFLVSATQQVISNGLEDGIGPIELTRRVIEQMAIGGLQGFVIQLLIKRATVAPSAPPAQHHDPAQTPADPKAGSTSPPGTTTTHAGPATTLSPDLKAKVDALDKQGASFELSPGDAKGGLVDYLARHPDEYAIIRRNDGSSYVVRGHADTVAIQEKGERVVVHTQISGSTELSPQDLGVLANRPKQKSTVVATLDEDGNLKADRQSIQATKDRGVEAAGDGKTLHDPNPETAAVEPGLKRLFRGDDVLLKAAADAQFTKPELELISKEMGGAFTPARFREAILAAAKRKLAGEPIVETKVTDTAAAHGDLLNVTIEDPALLALVREAGLTQAEVGQFWYKDTKRLGVDKVEQLARARIAQHAETAKLHDLFKDDEPLYELAVQKAGLTYDEVTKIVRDTPKAADVKPAIEARAKSRIEAAAAKSAQAEPPASAPPPPAAKPAVEPFLSKVKSQLMGNFDVSKYNEFKGYCLRQAKAATVDTWNTAVVNKQLALAKGIEYLDALAKLHDEGKAPDLIEFVNQNHKTKGKVDYPNFVDALGKKLEALGGGSYEPIATEAPKPAPAADAKPKASVPPGWTKT